MNIIGKFLIKNVKEKKLRTLLIIISVAVSSALFFASTAISKTFEETYIGNVKSAIGDADIMVSPGKKAALPYISSYKVNLLSDEIQNTLKQFRGQGTYKSGYNKKVPLELRGYDLEELNKINPIIFYDRDTGSFKDRKIIISKKTADKYGLKVGKSMPIEVNGFVQNYNVYGIAEPEGVFKSEIESTYVIMPITTLNRIYGAEDMATTIFVKSSKGYDKDKIKKDLSKLYKGSDVSETINSQTLRQETSKARVPFLLMLVVVVFMSIFIIYSVFKVIMIERLPIIGTFRSIGATRKVTEAVFLIESAVYGIVGGVIGCFLGVFILYVMADITNTYKAQGVKTAISFAPSQMVIAFFMAVLLAVVSSFIPIAAASSKSIKEVVLSEGNNYEKEKSYKVFLGIPLLLLCILCVYFYSGRAVLFIDSLCIAGVIISAVLLVPAITKLLVGVIKFMFQKILSNESLLALKNLNDNRSVTNNVTLLSIGITAMFVISTITYSFGIELTSSYSIYKFDIFMSAPQADKSMEMSVRGTKNVEDVLGVYAAWNTKVVGTDETILETDGVDQNKFLDYFYLNMNENSSKLLKGFSSGRNILLTNALKDRLKVKAGDSITLKMPKGNKSYVVAGFFNSNMQNGSYAFIPERYERLDTGDNYYNYFAVKAHSDVDGVKAALNKKFMARSADINEVNDFKQENRQEFKQLITILNIFSFIAVAIGILGLFNNFTISFIQRKRSLAVLASLGMSKVQRIKMIFVESCTVGIVGGTIGAAAGYIVSSIIPVILKSVELPINIKYNLSIFLLSVFAGVIVTMVSNMIPAFKSSKIDIIESVKYE